MGQDVSLKLGRFTTFTVLFLSLPIDFRKVKKPVERFSLITKELEFMSACEEWIFHRQTARTFVQCIYEQKLSKTKSLDRLYFHVFFSWPTLPGPPAASDTTAFELYFLRVIPPSRSNVIKSFSTGFTFHSNTSLKWRSGFTLRDSDSLLFVLGED